MSEKKKGDIVMLQNPYFYHSIIRNYVVAFGSIFSDITIERPNGNKIKVPIAYGPREKFLAKITNKDEFGTKNLVAITMPRMSFSITGFDYDATRHLNKTYKFVERNSSRISSNTAIQESLDGIAITSYTSVPYDINFDLVLLSKTETDGALMMDKIMPRFTPNMSLSIKLEPLSDVHYSQEITDYISNFKDKLNVTIDTPIILNSVAMEDSYEGDFTTRRALTWTFSFTMKGVFFGPTKRNKTISTILTSMSPDSKENTIHPLRNNIAIQNNWLEIVIPDIEDYLWEVE